jgi:CRP-like cAMP-binding protein
MNPAELFRQESNTVQLAPGDFLFREGEKGDKMYVLLEGEVDIFLGDLCSRLPAQARCLARWR